MPTTVKLWVPVAVKLKDDGVNARPTPDGVMVTAALAEMSTLSEADVTLFPRSLSVGSENVNGVAIEGQLVLEDGDVVRVGSTELLYTLSFDSQLSPEQTPPMIESDTDSETQ